MASFAHLSREERLGLGIAAAVHVALGYALWANVQDKPTALPIPERMSVSLADEVSLEATAPDPSAEAQAAVAPVLAPVPEPVVERRQVVRDRVIPKPTPTPTRQAGGTRLSDDFLEGVGGSERTNSRGTPAATFGPAEAASLNQAIARQLKPHWSAPQGADAELLVTIVRFRLNQDGSLSGSPTCARQSGETPSNAAQKALHCERAMRAVRLAAPFDLPEQFYDKWKLINSTFDRRL